MRPVTIHSARTPAHLREIVKLFREYEAFLGFDLCFQSFDEELATLPGKYAPPEGRLFLARANGAWAGCIAMKKIGKGTCEMKRLFVRGKFRGLGIGRKLAEKLVREAKKEGYEAMKLDTVPKLKSAIGLYRSMGFEECEPYVHNPIEGALFFLKRLTGTTNEKGKTKKKRQTKG